MHDAVLICRPLQPEVEPLCEIGGVVGTQGEADVGRIGQVFDDDRTGIEAGADFNHGKVLAVAGFSNRINRDFTARIARLQPARGLPDAV